MILKEYMSVERFPKTTQLGLSANRQLTLDALNYDELKEKQANGEPLTEEEREVFKELQIKMRDVEETAKLAWEQEKMIPGSLQ